MLIEQQKFLFRSARVILDDSLLLRLLHEKRHAYISGISYNKLEVGSGVRIKPKKTIVISLQSDMEEVFNGYSDTVKNEIRRTFSMPELAFRTDSDIDQAYELYRRFEERQGRTPHNEYSFRKSKIFNAYLDGLLVSSIACYDAFPHLRVRAIYSRRLVVGDKKQYAVIGYATKRLIYGICSYGKKNGYKDVDMGSVNLTDPKKKGIAQFKSSFGGTIVDEYTYTYESFIYRIFSKFI